MNETLSSSLWPNFPTSRPNLNDQFVIGEMNAWQQNIPAVDIYNPDVYNNVWSDKSNNNDEIEKESFIKSIWSTNGSSNNSCTETSSHVSDGQKNLNETPTNSPSLKRTEIINCNERWGNVKINQITPWSVIEIDESEQRPHDPMVWRAKIDGTEVWEDYYLRQHGRRLPQADTPFNNENVWSSASEISQSTNSVWPPNKIDMNVPVNDIFSPNLFSDINSRPNFSSSNGVRPSMTRNQAQKYLIDMGYSLSDAIGALVNNQMDLPKAINELQSKYRMSSNGPTNNVPNGMYTPTLSFNNRPGDSVNMTRIPPGTPFNSMVGQNNASITPMMAQTNFSNNFDMFHSDPNEQIPDSSSYMGIDPGMAQYGRMSDQKRQASLSMGREPSYRSTFPSNGMNNTGRSMSSSSSASVPQYQDMNVLGQNMSRMNLSMNTPSNHMMMAAAQNNNSSPFPGKWTGNSNGFNPMHNMNGNSNSMMLNNGNGGNIDMRQNYGAAPSAFGRSISKQQQQQQQMYQRNPSAMAWLPDSSTSISPNGALNDINHVRLAKNLSCPGFPDTIVGIIIRKVASQHIELIKSICFESGAMTNFQLQPHTQSIVVHFNSSLDARRCMSIIQNQINVRVELINDDYLHCVSGGAACQ